MIFRLFKCSHFQYIYIWIKHERCFSMWKGLLRIAHTNVRLLNYNNKFCIRLLFFTPNTSSYTFITLLALPISKLYKPKVQFASRRFVLQEYGKRQLYLVSRNHSTTIIYTKLSNSSKIIFLTILIVPWSTCLE